MRPLSTDRPDKTESPYTVDAGHVQIEFEVFSYLSYHNTIGSTDLRLHVWNVAPLNLKVGLLNNVDLQIVLDNYLHLRAEDLNGGATVNEGGFGDVTTRLKINLWGNDDGPTALAMMPFLILPANSFVRHDRAVQGGVIFPFRAQLPAGFSLGAMAEFDCLRNLTRDGYDAVFVNTLSLSHQLIGKLDGYVEFYSEVNTGITDWIGTVDVGLTYLLTKDIQLDTGVNLGVTPAAPDVQPFLGITFRF